MCGLLESLLAAEPGLAGRLDCLVGQLARYTPDPPLIAWLRRMFSLLASLDKSLLKDVSIGQCCGAGSYMFSGLPDPHSDPLVTSMDPGIRLGIRHGILSLLSKNR